MSNHKYELSFWQWHIMFKETPEGFMCCGAKHVSVTERVLIWHSPRVYLNVNKCFSCILNGVCSLNSQRRRKDGGGKEKEREKETDWGRTGRETEEERACALVHAASCSNATVTINLCLRPWAQGCNKAASRAPPSLTQTSCTLPWQPHHDPHVQDTSLDA